jgi:hypothetical protein
LLQDTNQCLSVLVPQAKCDFLVTFKSKKLGQTTDSFKLTYINQENNLTAEPTLGVLGVKTKVVPTGSIKASWTFNGESEPNFGKSRVEDITVIYVNVKNESDIDAIVNKPELLGQDFKLIDFNNCLTKINAQSSCTFKIQFDSQNAGKYENGFKIELTDETETFVTLLETILKGEKVAGSAAPVVTISEFDAQGLEFGEVAVGSQYNKLLEINNKNGQDLVVSLDEILFSGSSDFNFTGGEFPGTRGTCKRIVRAGRCLVEVTFAPKSIGAKTNLLTMKSSSQNILKTSLSGTGVENSSGTCDNKSDYLFFAEGKFNTKDKSIVYPYHTSLKTTPQKLSLLYGLEINERFNCLNCEGVKDAMVLSRYNNITWPKNDFVDAKVQVHVGKVHKTRKWLYTEMLCLQNSAEKICSGELFDKVGEKSWYALLNMNFFNTRPGPVNLEFNNMLFDDRKFSTVTTADGQQIDMAVIMKSLSIGELYNLSAEKVENILRTGFLNVILVDDLKNVSYPRLLVTAKKDLTCEKMD